MNRPLALTVGALALAAALPLAVGSVPAYAPAGTPAPPAAPVVDASLPTVTVYKSPTCGCCGLWVDHLRADGFPVEVVETADVAAVKAEHGIPAALGSCHTSVVDGYAVEGHVPAADIRRLLAERPEADGLALPGMPAGAPGMGSGTNLPPYEVLLVADGAPSVFARH